MNNPWNTKLFSLATFIAFLFLFSILNRIKNKRIGQVIMLLPISIYFYLVHQESHNFNNFYKQFDLKRDSPTRIVKKRYRKWIKVLHPDINKNVEHQPLTINQCQELRDLLVDDFRRSAYDKFGAALDKMEDEVLMERVHYNLLMNKIFEYMNLILFWNFVIVIILRGLDLLHLWNFFG